MADPGPFFEYRQVYAGFGETLKVHLQTRLQPWRWPIMLATGGIRVERGGKALPNLTVDYRLNTGDVIVIDDAFGKTWMDLMCEARINFRDYVFCPQRADDEFLQSQVRALLMEKTAQDIPLKHNNVDLLHLQALSRNLIPLADHPIRHLIIVTHATEFGDLLLPMRPENTSAPSAADEELARYVTWESLNEALALGDKNPLFIHDPSYLVEGKAPVRRADGSRDNRFSKVLPRPERPDGKFVPFAVIIRGCTSGSHTIFLNKIREAMGYMVDIVVMPKMFDATATRGREMVEYFQHDLEVTSPKALKRDEVVAAFKSARLRNWLGEPMPADEWETLVPKGNLSGSVPVKEVRVKVKGRKDELRLKTFLDTGTFGISPMVMTQTEKPDEAAIREFLNKTLARKGLFDNGPGDWPIWKRLGLASLKAFTAHFNYQIMPNSKSAPGNWIVHSERYYYRIRTPLTEKGVLLADYHPGPNGGEPTRLIDFNDDRVFGRSDPPARDPKYPHVGENFSRTI